MSAITPIGQNWESVSRNLKNLKTGIRYMPDWDCYDGLNTRLAAPVQDFEKPAHFNRKITRSMGRGSIMVVAAGERALEQAGLLNHSLITDGSTGIACGSSSGSPDAIADFGVMLLDNSTHSLNANTYIKMMSHTAPVNLAVYFHCRGRILTTSSACTSSSQAIGYAFEAIKHGYQRCMLAGGTDELSATQAAVFDTLFATSTLNNQPDKSPRPFDRNRDGLVIGEGAGIMVLEELELAKERGALILAEVVGYGTNCDGLHVTRPNPESMLQVMAQALDNAGLTTEEIGYISAHGTATEAGDEAESRAMEELFGDRVPVSSLKSFTGHTLGACGVIEAWAAINMMNEGWFHPTANLDNVDPKCGALDYIRSEGRSLDCEYVMSNNFAFGGINTSLVFRRWS